MVSLQTVFIPKQKSIAEFIAYLTSSAVYEKDNVIRLVNETELKELIAQKLEKKDFIGASELFDDAKKSLKPIQEVSEVVSKSIRLPFIAYLGLIETAHKKNMSLSDAIRVISIPAMINKLNEFKAVYTIDQEKLKVIYDLLQEWKDKKPTSAYKVYYPEFNYSWGDKITNSFEKFVELSINERCRKYEFPIEVMKDYLNNNIDFEAGWEMLDSRADLEFDLQYNSFKLSVYSTYFINFHKYEDFKKSIGEGLQKKIDDVLDFKHGEYDADEDVFTYYVENYFPSRISTISGALHIEDNKLFFDEIDVEKRTVLNAFIFEKITNEKYTSSTIDEYVNKVHEALEGNDYDTAARLNEKLAIFQVVQEMSNLYSHLISSVAEESTVVTFTIPKLLLMLWEATKGNRSTQEFVEENFLWI